mmetsp:Transcript_50365/g.80205  ORF Transcript_50365/g.80205 Transcript_50365/m.80205 type:complete len:313 (-) Transcript_50365:28-966(-)
MLPKQDNDEFETKQEQKDTDKQVQPVYTKCTLHEFFNLVQQTRDIYDLRPVDAFQKSHLYGAKNIPAPMKLAKFQSQNVLHLPVVLYGDKQSTSEAVLVHLATLIAAAADRNTRVYAFDGEYESDIVRKYAFLCKPQLSTTLSYPNMIIEDALFLGDGFMAEDKGIMLDLGITHIVNVTSMSFMLDAEVRKHIEYLQLPLDDSTMEAHKMTAYFEAAAKFVDDALITHNKQGSNRVYVHCMAGVSRSASIVIAYLMKSRKYSYCAAFMHVKKCRPRIGPNAGFMRKLEEYEKSLFGTSSAGELEEALKQCEY